MTTERPGPHTDAAAATTAASVLRGGVWNFASRSLPQFYVLVVSVVAARYLGPDGLGRQSFISFVALSTTMALTGGLSLALMRSIGATLGRGDPAAVRGLVRWAWRVELAGAALGGGILVAVAAAGAEPEAAWVLAAVGCSLGVMHSIPTALLIGAQRWREASIVGLVTGTLTVPAMIAVLAADGGITGMFAVEAVFSAVNLLWTSLLAARVVRGLSGRAVSSPELRRQTTAYAVGSSVNVILSVVVYKRSEFFFLDRFSSDSEIAIYSIAFAAVTALALLPEAITAVVVPAFATLVGAGAMDRLRSGFGRGLRLLALVTLPITAGMVALGPEAIRLVYGDEYSGTGDVLRVLMVVFPLLPLMNVSYALVVGLGRLRPLIVSNAAAAAVNVVLAFLLIPPYDAVGAGIANAAAQVVVAVMVMAYTRRALGRFDLAVGSLLLTAVAAAAGGIVAYAIVSAAPGVAGCAAGLVAGSVVFGALAIALRILPRRDADWLTEMAGERLGGLVGKACRLLSRPAPAETRP
jgi:O-antigen/teichoic acid export membrane protein